MKTFFEYLEESAKAVKAYDVLDRVQHGEKLDAVLADVKNVNQKLIKELIKDGAVIDVNEMEEDEFNKLVRNDLDRLKFKKLSGGAYGMNGCIVAGKDGKFYGVASRSSRLFAMV